MSLAAGALAATAWPADAAAAGLKAFNANSLAGRAGASLLRISDQRVLTGLPTITSFDDDARLKICRADWYTARVNWGARGKGGGHGSLTRVIVHNLQATTCSYDVEANYVYHRPGTYRYSVRICRVVEPKACLPPFSADAVIGAPSFSGTAFDLTATAGATFEAVVALIRDDNRYGGPDGFAPTIDWGDGTPPEKGELVGMRGAFMVRGRHTFQTPGAPVVKIDVRRPPEVLRVRPKGLAPARPQALTLVSHVTVNPPP